MKPSVWNLAGDEARTALTAYVFQVRTASGAVATGLWVVAEATDSDAVAATATMPTKMSNVLSRTLLFISPRFRTRPPRRRGRGRGRRAARRAQRRGPTGRRR